MTTVCKRALTMDEQRGWISDTLLAGEARNLKHTVEKVIPSPLFSPLPVRGRVSATTRVAGEQCI